MISRIMINPLFYILLVAFALLVDLILALIVTPWILIASAFDKGGYWSVVAAKYKNVFTYVSSAMGNTSREEIEKQEAELLRARRPRVIKQNLELDSNILQSEVVKHNGEDGGDQPKC